MHTPLGMADMDGRYSPDDPYCRLGPVHTCLYVRVRETGDWDLFRPRGKQGGFSPGASARHSPSARANRDSRSKWYGLFSLFFFDPFF